ncbi:MAG: transcriptional regulator [Nanoarchaeota archaeon]
MTYAMPQEIEVWYVIPALRRELARTFIEDHHLSQKEASKILGITESAISQYLKAKRGKELKFNKDELDHIKLTAKKMISDRENLLKYMYALLKELRGSKSVCALHHKFDKTLSCDCTICTEQ